MGRNPWPLIEKQKEYAIENPITSAEDIKRGYPKYEFFESLYDDAGSKDGNRYIPLSYYTKACAWASDYPWLYKRAMAYINPGPLSVLSLDEYVLREFGCNIDTLAQLIADKWFIPLLNDRDKYPRHVQRQITNLFKDAVGRAREDIEPRYFNIVDLGLEAGGVDAMDEEIINRAKGADRLDIDATKENWKDREPWSKIPRKKVTLHGVEHQDLQDYVVERAVKLRLADRVLKLFSEGQENVTNIEQLVQSYVTGDSNITSGMELAENVYELWNYFGTPAYYCDMSGTVDVGPKPLTELLKSSIQGTFSKLAKRFGIGLKAQALRPIHPGNVQFWASEDVEFRQLFKYGPDAVEDCLVEDRYRFLANRASAFEEYYSEMLAGGSGKMHVNVLDSAEQYDDVITAHKKTAPTRSYPMIRQIAMHIGDAVILKDNIHPLLNLESHRSLYSASMSVFENVLTPSATALLINAGTSTFRVPRWQASPPTNNEVIERDDVSNSDVWQVPYGNWKNTMNQFTWTTKETLLRTLLP